MTVLRVSLLVTGSRDDGDEGRFAGAIGAFEDDHGFEVVRIIQGGASGWDAMARDYARTWEIPCETFDADWATCGRAAGPIRNRKMLREGQPDHVLAFAGGRGTNDMISVALTFDVPVWRPFWSNSLGRVVVRRLEARSFASKK